jgi:HAD superfamily hydrolase (TIGR01549 family)
MFLNRTSAVGNAILCPLCLKGIPSPENLVTLTLLVDLDDTLLGNDMATFVPSYLQGLGRHLSKYASPDRLLPTLLAATQKMIQNERPDRSLEETFDEAFYPPLGLDKQDLWDSIDTFYADVFPTFQALTHYRPEAVALIEHAIDCGYRVAVATNPLFPRTAILQRLAWSGITPQKYPLSLITSYETFHFSKPNPAYYAEILARLGWPEGPVVMVGDDLLNDIAPARRLGLPAFWVTASPSTPPEGPLAPTASGRLSDFVPWLESTPFAELRPDFSSSTALLAILNSSPAALATLTADLPPAAWTESPRPGEWSLAEISCHLRDVETEVNLPRLHKVLQETNPFLPGMDTDPWAEECNYFLQDGPQALATFIQERIHLLRLLSGLNEADWERPARHAIFGPTQLKELVTIIAGHDRLHVQQVHQVLAQAGRRLSGE